MKVVTRRDGRFFVVHFILQQRVCLTRPTQGDVFWRKSKLAGWRTAIKTFQLKQRKNDQWQRSDRICIRHKGRQLNPVTYYSWRWRRWFSWNFVNQECRLGNVEYNDSPEFVTCGGGSVDKTLILNRWKEWGEAELEREGFWSFCSLEYLLRYGLIGFTLFHGLLPTCKSRSLIPSLNDFKGKASLVTRPGSSVWMLIEKRAFKSLFYIITYMQCMRLVDKGLDNMADQLRLSCISTFPILIIELIFLIYLYES